MKKLNKKNKKLIKQQKVHRINKDKGLGVSYSTHVLAFFGLKIQKNKLFTKINSNTVYGNKANASEQKIIFVKQAAAWSKIEQYNLKKNNFEINNNSYKGSRLKAKLPLRGQRTHTNAKTSRRLLGKVKVPRQRR